LSDRRERGMGIVHPEPKDIRKTTSGGGRQRLSNRREVMSRGARICQKGRAIRVSFRAEREGRANRLANFVRGLHHIGEKERRNGQKGDSNKPNTNPIQQYIVGKGIRRPQREQSS